MAISARNFEASQVQNVQRMGDLESSDELILADLTETKASFRRAESELVRQVADMGGRFDSELRAVRETASELKQEQEEGLDELSEALRESDSRTYANVTGAMQALSLLTQQVGDLKQDLEADFKNIREEIHGKFKFLCDDTID